jgi:hypothetical protein
LWLLGAYLGERAVIGRMVLAATLLNLSPLPSCLHARDYDRVVPNLAIESRGAVGRRGHRAGVRTAAEEGNRPLSTGSQGQAVQHRATGSVLRARENSPRHSVGAMMTAARRGVSAAGPASHRHVLRRSAVVIIACALIGAIGGWSCWANPGRAAATGRDRRQLRDKAFQ